MAFILSILASLAVALTVTPAMALAFLGKSKPHEEPKWIKVLKELHQDWLLFFARWPKATLLGGLMLVGGACALVPFLWRGTIAGVSRRSLRGGDSSAAWDVA